jgi:hypothetical protein
MPWLQKLRSAALTGATIPFVVVLLAGFATTAPLPAQERADSAAFIVRLGADTVAVEQWVWTPGRLDAVSVTRSPRTVVRRYSLRFDGDGRVVAATIGDAAERPVEPAGAIPIAGGFYAPYAVAIARAARVDEPETTVTMMVGGAPREFTVRRGGRGFEMSNQFDVPMLARLRPDGTLLSIDAGMGSVVERTEWVDIDALAREYAARDEGGAGLGPLSPRDTVWAEVSGATVVIDYSRPSARGRPVMGNLVPYGEVWRTGANDATRLRVDRTMLVGQVEIMPGSYSLFTVPGRDSWDLIINAQTGMSGLARNPSQDVGRTTMQVRRLDEHVETFTIAVEPAVGGAMLAIRWGDVEARVPLTIMKEQ